MVLIAGTGSVCRGWRLQPTHRPPASRASKKEAKTGGWGWANDEGSGFWAGQKGYQAIFKELDGRGKKTKITKLLFKEWHLERKEDLMKKIYGSDSIRNISLISKIVDEASQMGDKVARSIMEEAGEELALLAVAVIKKLISPLARKRTRLPLVLVGAMFKSKIILNKLKKEIKKLAPRVEFIFPKKEPVIGAIKLAIENLK